MTDVLQLRFNMVISGESAIYSLLYAILNEPAMHLKYHAVMWTD